MRVRNKIVIIFSLAGIILWLADAVVDFLLFGQRESFIQALIVDLGLHEFYFRLLFLSVFVVCGIFIGHAMEKRKRLEDELVGAKVDWEETFDSITDAITIHDTDFNVIRYNEAAEKLLGISFSGTRNGRKCFSLYHGKASPPDICPSCEVMKTKVPAVHEMFEPHLNRFIEIRAMPRFDKEKRFIGITHVVRDTTEIQRIQNELKKNEVRYFKFLDASKDISTIKDDGFRYLFINKAGRDFFGKEDGIIGKTDHDLMPMEAADVCRQSDRRALEADGVVVTEEKVGEMIFETHKFRVEVGSGKMGIGSYIRDITDRKRKEKELGERMNVAELSAETGFILAGEKDLRKALRMCCEAIVKHTGALFTRIWILNSDENVLELQASAGLYTHTNGFHGRIPFGMYKIGLIAKERRPYISNAVPDDPRIHDKEWIKKEKVAAFAGHPLIVKDRLVGVIGLFSRNHLSDITLKALSYVSDGIAVSIEKNRVERELDKYKEHLEILVKERTAELEEANRKVKKEIIARNLANEREAVLLKELSTIFDNFPVGIVYLDSTFRIIRANIAFYDLIGLPEAYVVGKYCYDIVGEYSNDPTREGSEKVCSFCAKEECFRTGRPTVIERPLGKKFLRVTSIPEIDTKGDIVRFIEIVENITERKNAEMESFHARHLASLGELATGVSHEINNPVNGIINYAQLLLNRAAEGSHEHNIGSRILKESNRIADIVKGLLSFAHGSWGEKGSVNIQKVIHDALELIQLQLSKDGIKVTVNLSRSLPSVYGNHQQLEQVVLNIISNARYALNSKYQVTDNSKCIEITAELLTSEEGDKVYLTIFDNGTGIPSEIRDRIMNPFFTTKPVGVGTGLGLSISYGIIKEHNGKLAVDSVEGEYTRVRVELPVKA